MKTERIVDPESGIVYHINLQTGETQEFYNTDVLVGSVIFSPEQLEQMRKAREDKERRELMAMWSREKREKFTFINANIDFSAVPPAMVTRLIFLSTFAAYAGEDGKAYDKTLGTPLVKRGKQLQKKDLAGVLGVSKRSAAYFLVCVSPQFICEDKAGGLYLAKAWFVRGSLKRKQFVQYQKLYNAGVRKLYYEANGKKAVQLGYIFRMLPFINVQHNLICWNPMETNPEKVKPMTAREFCEQIGYEVGNLNRLMQAYRDIKFTVNGKTEHFCKIVGNWNKQTDGYIIVNPSVIYAGDTLQRMDIMRLFFNEQQK